MLRNLFSRLRGATEANSEPALQDDLASNPAPQSPASGRERRRAPRAPYARDGRLEVVGLTPRRSGYCVRTNDISTWGAGIVCVEPLPESHDAVLLLEAPDATLLRVAGKLINVRQLPRGEYAAAIAFQEPQVQFSADRIETAGAEALTAPASGKEAPPSVDR